VKRSARGLRLTIFVREDDIWHHKPVYAEIVHRAHKAGLAGATVVRGIEGYGVTERIHTTHPFRLRDDSPVLIVIVETEERVRDFLPHVEELIGSGLAVLDEVETVQYRPGERTR
jgi:PII-like signaling protein